MEKNRYLKIAGYQHVPNKIGKENMKLKKENKLNKKEEE